MSNPEHKKLPQQYNYREDTISLENVLISIARQIKVIIITPTILCTLTIINVLFFAKPVYTSQLDVFILWKYNPSIGAGGQFDYLQDNPNKNGFILKLLKAGLWHGPCLNVSLLFNQVVQKNLLQILTFEMNHLRLV